MKIVFIDTVHPLLMEGLKKAGHQCVEAYDLSGRELIKIAADAHGIVIRSRVKVDREFLSALPSLKFIARAGAGMENVDVAAAAERNIICLNAPEGNRDAVAEHALAMLLCLFNNLLNADRQVRSGEWRREENRGIELSGKTAGLIGYGNTGQAFAKRLSPLGVKVLAYDKYRDGFSDQYATQSTMEEIFAKADILSLHVPLTDETSGLVNAEFLGKFQNNIWLINTSRGGCVSTKDLAGALRTGKVSGACLDVLDFEDSSFEKFRLPAKGESGDWDYLIQSGKIVLSPHVAGWTKESSVKIAEVLLEKIRGISY